MREVVVWMTDSGQCLGSVVISSQSCHGPPPVNTKPGHEGTGTQHNLQVSLRPSLPDPLAGDGAVRGGQGQEVV